MEVAVAAAVSGVVAVGLSAITVAAVPCVVFASLQSLDIAAAVADFVILDLAFAALIVSATAAVAVVVLVLGIAGDAAVGGCSRISGSWSNHRRVGSSSRPVVVDCYGSQGSLRRCHHGAQVHAGCRD